MKHTVRSPDVGAEAISVGIRCQNQICVYLLSKRQGECKRAAVFGIWRDDCRKISVRLRLLRYDMHICKAAFL